MNAAFLLATLVPALTVTPEGFRFDNVPDEGVLSLTEHEFSRGVQFRDDAAAARRFFHQAARGYDELWRRGLHNPALALNRARSHRLAGDLPRSIAALQEGIAQARYDRDTQAALEKSRSAVQYPLDGTLAAECRPQPAHTIGTRMSPAEAYLIAGFLWLLVCGGVVRFAMTRAPWWLLFAATWVVALAVLGGLWWYDWRQQSRENRHPLVVVKEDVALRKGNGTSYPPRFDSRLPAGVEARVLGNRGGWLQVELAGGAVGWLPERAVIQVEE